MSPALPYIKDKALDDQLSLLKSDSRFRGNDNEELRFCITVASLDDGFALTEPALTILTDRQLFGERVRVTRRRKHAAREPEAILRDLSELTIGAPIVHADHGVGRYQGLLKLDIGRPQNGTSGGEFL